MVGDGVEIFDNLNDYVTADNFHNGDVINFKCSLGYSLVGSDQAVCGANGVFMFNTGEIPYCEGLFESITIFLVHLLTCQVCWCRMKLQLYRFNKFFNRILRKLSCYKFY